MQKVLLLGDSISMGYREYVKDILNPFYDVVYPYENGKFAAHIYRMLYEWSYELSAKADNVAFVYWNCGLWDVVRVFRDEPQTPLKVYEEYLIRIDKRLKKLFPNAKICFATTTPIIEERYSSDFCRLNNDIKQYNDISKKILNKIEMFDDLYTVVEDLHITEDAYIDATHFGVEVNKALAIHISDKILKAIPAERREKGIKQKNMKDVAEKIISQRIPIALWGAGRNYQNYHKLIQKYCDVRFVVDKNVEMRGMVVGGLSCETPEIIKEHHHIAVVMMMDSIEARDTIVKYCQKEQIAVCGYQNLLGEIYPTYEKEILKNVQFVDVDPNEQNIMKKYVGINVPAYGCNFACMYCYIDNKSEGEEAFPKLIHLPDYIRYRLGREKLGGCALIGVCGFGETLLADGLADICAGLLKEGHYLHIVTNGIITKKLQEILDKAGEYCKHIIFKISFHYLELKKKKLLKQFVSNVKKIEHSEASYTLELMPHDELVPYIQEVLSFSMENFGAYPQLTIGRNEHDNRKLLTRYSNEEYKHIWSVFESKMFEVRMNHYFMHGKNCNAGRDAFFVDLYTGRIDRCLFKEDIGNFYDDECKYDFERIGEQCPLDYCYNCHIYATLGLMSELFMPTYLDIRDRVTIDGRHWIKDDMRRFLNVKLYDVNKEFNNK